MKNYNNYNKSDSKTDDGITIATPPTDLLKILILQRRNDALDSIESYYKMNIAGAGAPGHIAHSRIITLFLDLEAGLRRHLDKEDFTSLQDSVFKDTTSAIMSFRKMNEYLDRINVIKVDMRMKINSSNAENENDARGL